MKSKKLVLVNCENCKNEFEKTETEFNRSIKRNNKHFCSLECSKKFHKSKLENKKCKFCGGLISYEKRFNIFCSMSCSASFNNKKNVGRKNSFSNEAIKNIQDANRKRFGVENYEKNPNYCLECNKLLPFQKRKNKFCNINCRKKFDKKRMTEFNLYKSNCTFKFDLKEFPDEFDFELINKLGWYSAKNRGGNLAGISRDHMFSIADGFKKNIDYKIISHPANCRLMVQNENAKKWKNSSISLENLKERILEWNLKYNKLSHFDL